jgi:hypothetical protein
MAKKIKLNMEAVSEILVVDTDWESGAENSDFQSEFEDFEDEQEQASTQQDAQADKWRSIINQGTASRKEHQYPSFCWSSKRFEKQ